MQCLGYVQYQSMTETRPDIMIKPLKNTGNVLWHRNLLHILQTVLENGNKKFRCQSSGGMTIRQLQLVI